MHAHHVAIGIERRKAPGIGLFGWIAICVPAPPFFGSGAHSAQLKTSKKTGANQRNEGRLFGIS